MIKNILFIFVLITSIALLYIFLPNGKKINNQEISGEINRSMELDSLRIEAKLKIKELTEKPDP